MKKRDVENMIQRAYSSEKIDLRSEILEACKNTPQEEKESPLLQVFSQSAQRPSRAVAFRRIAAVAACFALLLSCLSFAFIMLDGKGGFVLSGAQTSVYIDVNPSIELQISRRNKIVGVVAGNKDAEIVLEGMELEGIDLNTAIKAIVGSMYVNGYLTETSNSVLVSVSSKKESVADELLSEISAKINTALENTGMTCAVIAQCVEIDDELLLNASKYGVSVGKMHFLNKIINSYKGFPEDALEMLSGLSINDLNLIYLQKPNSDADYCHELIYGQASVRISSEEALNKALEYMGISEDDASKCYVYVRPSLSGEAKAAYGVIVVLSDDSTAYRYEVDFSTGELFVVMSFPTVTGDGIVYKDILFPADAVVGKS